LMDDRVDTGSAKRQLGGAHPHAGLETVTLVVEGAVDDRDEGRLSAGDALWMSAGSGVIHSEHIEMQGKARILQLWVRLPAGDRASAPSFELVARDAAPVRKEPGVEVRLYSGRSGALVSPTKNHAPVTLIDVALASGRTVDVALPAEQSGFMYVIDGAAEIGADATPVQKAQVGWLDAPREAGESVLRLSALKDGVRVILYVGEPQKEPLVHHGPFVAGSYDEIGEMFQAYRAGRFVRLSELQRRARAG